MLWNFTKFDSSEDNCLFNYDVLLNQVNVDDDEIIEDPNPKEYPEETNYENDWNIEEEINDVMTNPPSNLTTSVGSQETNQNSEIKDGRIELGSTTQVHWAKKQVKRS